MKIVFTQTDVLPAATTLQSLATQRGVYPILANVLIDASGHAISLVATDSEVAVRLKVPGTILESGMTTVPARKLADLVRQLPVGESITLEASSRHHVQLTCGRGTYRMIGLSPEDFPQISLSAEGGFLIETSLIRRMLTKTRFAASTEEERYFLRGVYFHLSPQWIRFVATDTRRLAVNTYPFEGICPKEKGALLPLKAVEEFFKTFPDGEEVRVAFFDKFVVFGNERATLTTRLLEGDYPPYHVILGQVRDYPILLRAERKGLLEVLSRVGLFANPRTSGVRLEAKENVLRVSATSVDFGEAIDEFDVEVSAPIQIAFNVEFLKEAIKVIDTDFVRIFFRDSLSAGVVRPDDETDHVCLVMPMRMEE